MAITRLGPNQDITAAKIAGQINFKNLIINGDMSIAQRGISSSSLSGYTSCDRFTATNNALDQLAGTLSQISDAPSGSGLSKSFKFTVTTPETTLEADEYQTIQHRIEGQNLQHLKYNTSSAESLTLSFWVKSSVTGTYATGLYLIDNNRNIGTTYTINSANTWEKKTLTFVGDTSGIIGNDNTEGLRLWFILGAGSTFNNSDNTSWDTYSSGRLGYGTSNNLLTTSSATWQITGLQLEVGTSASDFEFLPYDVNLQRCKRYFQRIWMNRSDNNFWGPQRYFDSNNVILGETWFSPEMRAQPSFSYTGTPIIKNNGGAVTGWESITGGLLSNTRAEVQFIKTGHGLTNSNTLAANLSDSSTFFKYDAEL